MPRIKVNGLTVHYQQAGSGRDLVLVHGLFSNLAFWYLSVLPSLARDARVTVYDLRGHGYSDMPPRGYTVPELATDLVALLDRLDIGHADLVGHSYGGAVALQLAAGQRERVRSVTEVDAYIPCFQPALPPADADSWRRARARLRRAGWQLPSQLPRVGYAFLEEVATHPAVASDLARWGGRARPDGRSRMERRWAELMVSTTAAHDLADPAGLTEERIRTVEQPVLAVFGERSGCLPSLRGLQRTLPNCQTVLLPGAGHFSVMVRPDEFVPRLERFLASTRRDEVGHDHGA